MASNGGGGDQQANCIIEACCPNDADGQAKQERALTKWVEHKVPVLTHDQAVAVAHAFASSYDFADKGTLYAFKQSIVRYAKGPAYTD